MQPRLRVTLWEHKAGGKEPIGLAPTYVADIFKSGTFFAFNVNQIVSWKSSLRKLFAKRSHLFWKPKRRSLQGHSSRRKSIEELEECFLYFSELEL